ncbi:conserved hypothetical protein [Geotrichum candidum]|uniref:F-box domain-containing protein n=1 Tax=Geotrichum candidum TaxID=1173061 RepID=A0A0J9XER3_GEOCN|nr:conserved hypothetical protein [Geotrichum candidum]
MSSLNPSTALLTFPVELVERVFGYLDGADLISLATTCTELKKIILDSDAVWKRLVKRDFGTKIYEPYTSAFELYSSLYAFRWLNSSIWFGDNVQFGSLLVSRYNPKTGTICLHKLLSILPPSTNGQRRRGERNRPSTFSDNPYVSLNNRHAKAKLFGPYVELGATTKYDKTSGMWTYPRNGGAIMGIMRVAALLPSRINRSMSVWPPFTITAVDRTRNTSTNHFSGHFTPGSTTPSSDLFRLKRFPSFGVLTSPLVTETFSRISPELLTPTPEFPWRGIWLADYSTHGPEFLLFHQPVKTRLEAIKLTGDVCVPRGEYSFIVENLNHALPITYTEWPNSLVCESKGQVSQINFTNPEYIEAQTILIDHNEIAQYWISMDYIMYLRRIDINELDEPSIETPTF